MFVLGITPTGAQVSMGAVDSAENMLLVPVQNSSLFTHLNSRFGELQLLAPSDLSQPGRHLALDSRKGKEGTDATFVGLRYDVDWLAARVAWLDNYLNPD